MHSVALLRLRHRTILGRYQTNNGQISILAGNGYDAIDPKRTSINGELLGENPRRF